MELFKCWNLETNGCNGSTRLMYVDEIQELDSQMEGRFINISSGVQNEVQTDDVVWVCWKQVEKAFGTRSWLPLVPRRGVEA